MDRWPELHYDDWSETLQTLQLWTQIVGKIRLKLEPLLNHWWNVALYVTPRGLGTGTMPYGLRSLRIEFDFLAHELRFDGCDGERAQFALEPMTVAAFYARVMDVLREMKIDVKIDKKPNEVAEAIPFDRDTVHKSYDPEYAQRFWRVLSQLVRLSEIFRARFLGKSSPVHFFWGSFDLAASRFSGKLAPPHPGGIPNLPDWITREAYSHEVYSNGFWPGGSGADALLYAYAYPTPEGLERASVLPVAAQWNAQLREFVLPYEAVRTSSDADAAVLSFYQTTYEAAAGLLGWDRKVLERA